MQIFTVAAKASRNLSKHPKMFQSLPKPSKTFRSLLKHTKASQSLPKPSRDCQSFPNPPRASVRDILCHKAAQSLSKPLKTAQQSLPKPYKTLQSRQSLPKPPRASQSLAIPPKASQKPYKASGSKNKWKIDGKTRDFCAKHAFLNEKIRYSHKRLSANPVKMQSNLTSLSPNTINTTFP